MPLEKIGQQKPPCLSPEHNPPNMIVLEPGSTYRYTCPSCGEESILQVPMIIC